MAFTLIKHAYTNYDTANPIDANNLNDIQDGIIDLEDNVVRHDLQTLTLNQQAQARSNINVGNNWEANNFTSSTDLNNIKYSTNAFCNGVVNKPASNAYGFLNSIFNASGNAGIQIYRVYSTSGDVNIGPVYQREYLNNQWYQWHPMSFSGNVPVSSLTLDSGFTATSNTIKKIENIIVEIHLYVESSSNITKGSWVRIGVVPAGYRPASSVYKICLDNTNGYPIETRITSAGSFSIWVPTSYPNFTLFAADIMYTIG